jgi:hypothetical protein
MSGSQALPQALQTLGHQAALRDARLRDEPTLETGAGREAGAFEGLMAELADAPEGGPPDSVRPDAKPAGAITIASPLVFLKQGVGEAVSLPSDETQKAAESEGVQTVALLTVGGAAATTTLPPSKGSDLERSGFAEAAAAPEYQGELTDIGRDGGAATRASARAQRAQVGGDGTLPAGLVSLPGTAQGHTEFAFTRGIDFPQADASLEVPSLPPYAPAASSEAGLREFSVQVSVHGRETHFAPVQTAEAVLARLVAGAVPDQEMHRGVQVDANPRSTELDAAATAASGGKTATETLIAVSARQATGQGDGALLSGREGYGPSAHDTLESGLAALGADRDELRASGEGLASGRVGGVQLPPGGGSHGVGAAVSQIARQIVAEFAADASRPAPSSAAAAAGTSYAPADGVLKVLHLRLEPSDLGRVTVRMDLKDNQISLHLEASHHDTARAIERDRELLFNALKSAGYVVDTITSQPPETARYAGQVQQASGADPQQALASSSQSQSGMAQERSQNGGQSAHYPEDDAAGLGGVINEGRARASQNESGALYV